jgi:hypothetical protein
MDALQYAIFFKSRNGYNNKENNKVYCMLSISIYISKGVKTLDHFLSYLLLQES